MYKLKVLIAIFLSYACVSLHAQMSSGQNMNEDEAYSLLLNRVYVGLQATIPQGQFNERHNGWMVGFNLGYWREISYTPWVLLGGSLGMDFMDSKVDRIDVGAAEDEIWSAYTVNFELMAKARLFPFREMLFNPYLEGHFGPSWVRTVLNYDITPDVDRGDIGLGYRLGGGMMLNLKNSNSLEASVFWADSTLKDYWQDDNRPSVEVGNPFLNFEPFRSRFSGIFFQLTYGYSF